MKLHYLVVVSVLLFAFLRYYAIPRVRKLRKGAPPTRSIKLSAWLACLGWIQGAMLLTAYSGGLLLLFLLLSGCISGSTPTRISSTIKMLQGLHSAMAHLTSDWSLFAVLLILFGLALYSYRRGRIKMSKTLAALHQAEVDRLLKEYEAGRWPILPPTPDMERAASMIAERNAAFAQLRPIAEQGNAKAFAACQKLLAELEQLRQISFSLDVTRRIEVVINPEDTSLPEAQDIPGRIQTIFFSQGLLATLGRGARILYATALILLIPSLVGVYAPQVGRSLEMRVATLDDLRVKLTQEQAAKSWQEAKQQLGTQAKELTDSDKQLLKALAANFEERVVSNNIYAPLRLSRQTAVAVRSTIVRRQILTGLAQSSETPLDIHPGGAAGEADPTKNAFISAVEEDFGRTEPVTPLGKAFYRDAEEAASRSPQFMERLRESFRTPATPRSMVNALAKESLSVFLGEDIAQPLRGMFSFGSPDLQTDVRAAFTAQKDEVLSSLFRGASVDEAMEKAIAKTSDDVPMSESRMAEFQSFLRNQSQPPIDETIMSSLNEHPPGVDSHLEDQVDWNTASAKLRENFPHNSPEAMLEHTEALATYSDYFPSHLTAAEETPRGKLLAQLEKRPVQLLGGSGTHGGFSMPLPTGGTAVESAPSLWRQASRSLFANSRSFSRLRGFSRVGGVLIGQQADTNSIHDQPDITNISWVINGNETRLTLQNREGKQIHSRPIRTVLIHQSLAYAADGRPLAATMVTAKPLQELKILVHPALIDTGLGRRIIDLDRFVDTYVGGDVNAPAAVTRIKATELVYEHQALFNYAWACREEALSSKILVELRNSPPSSDLDDLIRYATNIIRYAHSLEEASDTMKLAQTALLNAESMADRARSPLLVKTEFFDFVLVEWMMNAARTTHDLHNFGKKIAEETRNAMDDPVRSREAIKSFFRQPPEFITWSGVREKTYSLHMEEIFPLEGKPLPSIFDFMLQLAFTSEPEVGNRSNYADTSPWEFPGIQNQIQAAVLDAIQTNATDHEIYQDSIEFALLQRFFRVALAGQLGADFPMEKLPQLASEAREAAPANFVRTPRWNVRLGGVEERAYLAIAATLEQSDSFSSSPQVIPDSLSATKNCSSILLEVSEKFQELVSAKATTTEAALEVEWRQFLAWQKEWTGRWSSAVTHASTFEKDLEQAANSGTEKTARDAERLYLIVRYLHQTDDTLQLRRSLGCAIDDKYSFMHLRLRETPPSLMRMRDGAHASF